MLRLADKEPEFSDGLADKIRAYWAARGYTVTVWVAQTRAAQSSRAGHTIPVYCIRSDLLNGMPKRPAMEEAA